MEQMPNNSNSEAITFDGGDYFGDSYETNNVPIGGSSEWPLNINNAAFSATSYVNPSMSYNNFLETQSDGDITPSSSLLDGSATPRWPLP